jgi:hypothetical protein
MPGSGATETISGTQPKTDFRGCSLCSCKFPAKKKNPGLGAVLLSCLVSKLQKPSSPELETRTVYWGCGICLCNLLTKINNFGLDTIFLSCLVSELQKPPLLGLVPSTLFRSFGLSEISLWFQGISMPSLGQIGASILE